MLQETNLPNESHVPKSEALTSIDIDASEHSGIAEVHIDEHTTRHDSRARLIGEDNKRQTFYSKYIEPLNEKGFISNCITFFLMVFGRLLLIPYPHSFPVQLLYQFGLFGFAGGITNWLAIKMLFDKVPFLYGSGVIPNRFKEIRETVKNVILATFFDEIYLKRYLEQKATSLLGTLNLEEKLTKVLESPEVDKIIEEKLAGLSTKPEGMLFAMMGINPVSLKPLIKPFVTGLGSEVVPYLTKNFDLSSIIKIETIRTEIDNLMTTKLLELTPQRVKKLMEEVIRTHLGWLIVWGNVFGGLIGIVSAIVTQFEK